ncbi:cell division control protein 14 [Moniliophthora roreri MCA 2997]|uniref:Cell division control protein 14 n=1 Tax=Moniliophthora roreri (strain MCA 2997) TaxID=1381753 RepID=V2WRB1_MONRO|nr:cell division control protein 14 [Moniliophthora roreri MCA 2997]
MEIQHTIQDALDSLLLPSTSNNHLTALQSLESLFVTACLSKGQDYDWFLALQGTFECNVVARLIPYLSHLPINTSSHTPQLAIAISLIQGIVLNHLPSKAWLGRKAPLGVLVELLLASRHLPSSDDSKETHLSSAILDTLLCILVDSPIAIRAFEEVKGVEAVVRLLKRGGTCRSVRMKCLEFLYFYLLDETSPVPALSTTPSISVIPTPPPSNTHTPSSTNGHARTLSLVDTPSQPAPKTITKPKPFITPAPIRPPTSRYGSSTYSFTSGSESGGAFSTSTLTPPESRNASFSEDKERKTSDSAQSSPKKSKTQSNNTGIGIGLGRPGGTPRPTPAKKNVTPEPRALRMLKRDVEFVPQSPSGIPNPLLATPAPRRTHGHAKTKSLGGVAVGKAASESVIGQRNKSILGRTASGGGGGGHEGDTEPEDDEDECRFWGSSPPTSTSVTSPVKSTFSFTTTSVAEKENNASGMVMVKTTAQKTAHLSTMLGNVDALVEGVRRAGIWGVG